MSRQRLTLEVDGTIFAMRGWKAHGLALGAGLRPTFSGIRGAWIADTKRLPQFTAYLEYRNVGYLVTDAGVVDTAAVSDETPAPSGAPVTGVTPDPDAAQLSLFDGSR